MKNFFRNDLNLNSKWWHRLIKVTFIIFIVITALLGYGEFNLTGYSKLGTLSDYIQNKPQTIQQIIDNTKEDNIVLSGKFEPTNRKDDSWITPRDAICAKDLTDTVKNFESKGYELYIGPMFGRTKTDSQTLLKDIQTKEIDCIIPTFYTGTYNEKIPMVQTYEDDDYNSKNIFLYKPNSLKTAWYLIFGTYFSNSVYVYSGIWSFTLFPSLILIFIYYKLILYIIFGAKKK
jgi:hypothetical protein